jgi:hypothetical protein
LQNVEQVNSRYWEAEVGFRVLYGLVTALGNDVSRVKATKKEL